MILMESKPQPDGIRSSGALIAYESRIPLSQRAKLWDFRVSNWLHSAKGWRAVMVSMINSLSISGQQLVAAQGVKQNNGEPLAASTYCL